MKQRDDLIKAYASGTPSSELVRRFGVSKGALWSLLDEAGVIRRVNSPTEEHLAEAKHLYLEAGWSLAKIAKHLGFASTTIYRHLKLRNAMLRRPGRPGAADAPRQSRRPPESND